ncbi:MAG: tRNA (adenosine(37)-N6)-threonylcarbamoyltransferase complex dimerization subunit type 1 TsaB, partial [Thermoleophilia bacterium]|nr:tRNA (adenosine(37)-N6)-threonylcarbamoyltransferase complex dimerization subunit type 1 TsaB [Thermoleophilia bacterium]
MAFDTATAACSVAIRRRDGALFDHRPATARMFEQPAHATDLLPAIVELLERAELDWSDLDRLAVGVGPGAFTGLRIGVASARAIATARSLPLTPVSSLAALAAGAGAGDTAAVLPVIDALAEAGVVVSVDTTRAGVARAALAAGARMVNDVSGG